jgi:aminoglycoside phosphotransferase (APT) family kinase protein
MRKDLPVDFISSVESEFSLLQSLFKQRFPVAEPCWLESDPSALGARFLVSRLVAGSTDVSRWISDRAAARGFARQLAELMGRLHALSLPALGFSPSLARQSAGDCMRLEIDRWHATFLSSRLEAYPLVELTLEWLKQHIPPTLYARPGALVHGDIGFHNMMIDNGHLTALLDWEFAHPGDPLEDLVYTKPFVESVMDWTTFKQWYRDLGGPACSEEEEMFYAVWSKTRNQISAIRATRLFMGSQPNNLKFAAAGFVLARYFEPEAARMVLSALGNSSNSRR